MSPTAPPISEFKYAVQLVVSGPDAAHYNNSDLLLLTVLPSTGGPVYVPPPPALSSVVFDAGGSFALATYSAATDSPSFVGGKCNSLLSFVGSALCSCLWLDSSTVRILFPADTGVPLLTPGAAVTSRKNALRPYCASGSCNYKFINVSTVNATVSDSAQSPVVVLSVPSTLGACANLTIDASSSFGSASRRWMSVAWQVFASDASPTSSILKYLDTQSLRIPFIIPASAFKPSVTYTFSLTLTNFFGISAVRSAQVFVSPSAAVIPLVTISGPQSMNIFPSTEVSVTAQASIPYCLSSTQPIVTYKWSVFNDSSSTAYSALTSTSQDPKVFTVPPYSLLIGHSYRFVVTVSVNGTKGIISSASASASVFVLSSPVTATISGGFNRVVSQSTLLTLDASQSVDGDVDPEDPQGLTFLWSCIISSGPTILQSCDDSAVGILSKSKLKVQTTKLSSGTIYKFTVFVTSSDGKRSDSTSVTVSVVAASASSVSVLASDSTVNSNDVLTLPAVVSGSNGTTFSWTIPSDASISASSISVSSSVFTISPVQNNIPVRYSFSFTASTLVPGASYTFRLSSSATPYVVFAEVTVQVRVPPSLGSLAVSPIVGVASGTSFLLTASDWAADQADFPLSYQFSYDLFSTVPTVSLGLPNGVNYLSTMFPAGSGGLKYAVYLGLTVIGATGSTSMSYNKITVRPQAPLSSTDIKSNLQAALKKAFSSSDINAVIRTISNTATIINSVNCTAAPNCPSLNRLPCSDTPATCGACLDGYYGVGGSSNLPCKRGSRRLQVPEAVIPQCTVSSDCAFGFCVKFTCVTTLKTCLYDCSGHGNCTTYDVASGASTGGLCLSSDANCRVFCSCHGAYSGRSCSVLRSDALVPSSIRGSLCSALSSASSLQDPSPLQLETIITSVRSAYNPFEIVTSADLGKCITALGDVQHIISSGVRLTTVAMNALAALLSELIDSSIINPKLYDDTVSSAVIQAAQALQEAVGLAMVPGQLNPVNIISDNFRASVHVDELSTLSGKRLVSPSSYQESQTGLKLQSVVLPNSGFTACGYTSGYVPYAVAQWGFKPYISDTNYISNVFGVTVYNGSELIMSTSNEYIEDTFTVQFNWDIAQNWNQSILNCSSIIGNASDTCSCTLVTKTPYSGLFSCSNVSTFCTAFPSSVDADFDGPNFQSLEYAALAVPYNPIIPDSSPYQPYTAGTVFLTVFLFFVLIGTIIIYIWDRKEKMTFKSNAAAIGKSSRHFNLDDSLSTPGLFPLTTASFTTLLHTSTGHGTQSPESSPDAGYTPPQGACSSVQSPVPLFADAVPFGTLYLQTIVRHHSILRIFSYPSLRLSRWLRFLCACTDIIILSFVNTCFYLLAFPKENDKYGCSTHYTYSSCINLDSYMEKGKSLCYWNEEGHYCELRSPKGDFTYYLVVSLIVIAISIIPQLLSRLVYEYVFTKVAWASKDTVNREVAARKFLYNDDAVLAKRLAKDDVITVEIELFAQCDEHLKNRLLLQFYLTEKLDPISSATISKLILYQDAAKPRTIGAGKWFIALTTHVSLWVFFIIWIYYFTTTTNKDIIHKWGVSFIFMWLVEIFLVETIGIFLFYVLPVVWIHPTLATFHDEMSHAAEQRASQRRDIGVEEDHIQSYLSTGSPTRKASHRLLSVHSLEAAAIVTSTKDLSPLPPSSPGNKEISFKLQELRSVSAAAAGHAQEEPKGTL